MNASINPKFSVVIPTYNRQELVLEAVESVCRQTYPAHEIIVVVDGSTDGTADAVRRLHPDVIVYEQENRGLTVARNSGLAIATGDWIGILDDDDLWHPEKLRCAVEYLQSHPDCEALNNPHWYFSASEEGPTERLAVHRDFVASNLEECVALADEHGLVADEQAARLRVTGDSMRLMLQRNRGVISSSLVKRTTLIRAGGACPMQICGEDWTMFVNVARLCEWHTLSLRLGFTRFHEVQMTNPASDDDLFALCVSINAWYTGRPLPQRTSALSMLEELSKYGRQYRQSAQGFHWRAIRRGDFGLAMRIRAANALLLPKKQDYFYTLLPPSLTWRWERHVLGLHK